MAELKVNHNWSIVCLTGILSIIVAWIVILSAWWVNPWFDLTRNAFSDLGSSKASDPWVFNYGMVITGLLVFLYGSYIYTIASDKTDAVGGALLGLSGVFLVQVGIFHLGTKPHVCVATWFFLLSDAALILLGRRLKSMSVYGRIEYYLALIAVPLAILIQYTIGWPSTAIAEMYGILLIDYGVIVFSIEWCRLKGDVVRYSRPSSSGP